MSSLADNSPAQANPRPREEKAHQAGAEPGSPRLTRRQVLALPIIAAAPNLTQGARNAGINESTLRRWRREEHFSRELDRLTRETADLTQQQLESLTLQSGQVLADLMQDSDPMVRLRAARAVAALGIQVSEAHTNRRDSLPAVEETIPQKARNSGC